ncbi:MAG: hypothetical protein K6A92_08795 [Lachnospiraceae bacterium]|nr:hypothetical protein [Lachnospiraceae bacterium]
MNGMFGTIIVLAALIGLIIGIVIVKSISTDGRFAQYDEMQQRARGVAYKYGFYTMTGCLALVIVLDLFDIRLPMEQNLIYMLIFLCGLTVQACTSIWKDAYVGLNTKMSRFLPAMVIIALFNLFVGISAIARGGMISEGLLQTPFINLSLAVIFVILAIVGGLKMLVNKREEED